MRVGTHTTWGHNSSQHKEGRHAYYMSHSSSQHGGGRIISYYLRMRVDTHTTLVTALISILGVGLSHITSGLPLDDGRYAY